MKCPNCKSNQVVEIFYGMPTEETGERAERGELILKGCCVPPNPKAWHCRECEHEWDKNRDFEPWPSGK